MVLVCVSTFGCRGYGMKTRMSIIGGCEMLG